MIAVAGTGVVGSALIKWLSKDNKVIPYSKTTYSKNLELVKDAEILFICVSTPYNNGYDDSALWDVLEKVKHSKIKTVVIKSTVVPNTTQIAQRRYPQFEFVFNPEFLTEKNAYDDFINGNRQILGCVKGKYDVGKRVAELLPKAEHTIYMSSTEAEIVKYAGNSFLATKVIWANMIANIANATDCDYKTIMDAVVLDERIGSSHTEIAKDGKAGYGGMCFPKDMKAIRDYTDQMGLIASDFFGAIDDINEEIR